MNRDEIKKNIKDYALQRKRFLLERINILEQNAINKLKSTKQTYNHLKSNSFIPFKNKENESYNLINDNLISNHLKTISSVTAFSNISNKITNINKKVDMSSNYNTINFNSFKLKENIVKIKKTEYPRKSLIQNEVKLISKNTKDGENRLNINFETITNTNYLNTISPMSIFSNQKSNRDFPLKKKLFFYIIINNSRIK